MSIAGQQIVLASASPRRLALLQQLGLRVSVSPANIDERVHGGEQAAEYVLRLAAEKSAAVAGDYPNQLVIGADTSIEFEGQILGKPVDQADCVDMLKMMQGKAHRVYTGVAVTGLGRTEKCVVETAVTIRALNEAEIIAYWETGEPVDKAGSYAIQGLGAMLVNRIEGSYSNVVGLPLCETAGLLAEFDVSVLKLFKSSILLNSSHEDNK